MKRGFFHHRDLTKPGMEGEQWVDKTTGIGTLYPKAQLDSFPFELCGYSCNWPQDNRYFTIHITPEPTCSYASFETNIPVEQSHVLSDKPIEALVTQVVSIFRPETFAVLFFASHHKDYHSHDPRVHAMPSLTAGYQRMEQILYGLDGYDLVGTHFVKKPVCSMLA